MSFATDTAMIGRSVARFIVSYYAFILGVIPLSVYRPV